ncbi:MAG TPA: hypothetical protein V6D47_14955 [Oscillatoriaceae cyanobacterium]
MKMQLAVLALVLIPSQAFAATATQDPAPVHRTLHAQIGHQIVNGAKNVGHDAVTVGKQTVAGVKAVGSDVKLAGHEVGHAVGVVGRAAGRGISDVGNGIQRVFTHKSVKAAADSDDAN